MFLVSKIRDWLRDVPVADPVDRRNAPFMQMLLLYFGCEVPLDKAYYLLFTRLTDVLSPVMKAVDLGTDAAMTVAAWTALVLIRRGHFRPASWLYLSVMLASALLAYLLIGMEHLAGDDLYPVFLLGLAGLMLGRRALWIVFAGLLGVFAMGTVSEVVRQSHGETVHWEWQSNVLMAESLLVMAVLLDRTIAGLRKSLDESDRRGDALARANQQVEREMAERERAQGQLVHAQKMEAVGRVASGVAHDFDNVLNVVLGYAQRREHLADQGTPALVAALEGVELAARRALAVSRQLLNFGRQDTLRPELFDAAQALRDTQTMLLQLFDTDVRVSVAIEVEGALPVRLDRGQFELMLLNIAANARDAMPEGGHFAVALRRAGAGELELVLTDDGCGMSEEVRAHVFEPFYTTKPKGAGTGLGLAVVHDMVMTAHGSLAVNSALGEGTSFRVRLPLVEVQDSSRGNPPSVSNAA